LDSWDECGIGGMLLLLQLLLLLLLLLLLSLVGLLVLVPLLLLVLVPESFVLKPTTSILLLLPMMRSLLLLVTAAVLLLVFPQLQGGSVLGASLTKLLFEGGLSVCSCRKAELRKLLETILYCVSVDSVADSCLQEEALAVVGQIEQQLWLTPPCPGLSTTGRKNCTSAQNSSKKSSKHDRQPNQCEPRRLTRLLELL
jgi:hypothetical protein